MRKNFEEIRKDELKTVNTAIRKAIEGAPGEDIEDGLKLLELIEEKRWFGKIEYPVSDQENISAINIRCGVFHSMSICIKFGKWRFTRTEFNKSIDFKGKNGERDKNYSG
ncbi:MAG: hypothetical protein JXB48_21220 [Candidatus Latescibacteria bacterium]|nr:hypothetical protein [Candidatus Latescibacterota bacterium]